MTEPTIRKRQIDETVHAGSISFASVVELSQLRELASGASVEIFQLEIGVMQGELAHVELGSSSVHSNSFSLSARGLGPVSNDRWTFVVFPSLVAGSFNCKVLELNDLLLYRPGAEFEGTTYGSFTDWVFTIDDASLREFVRIQYDTDLPNYVDTCTFLRPTNRQQSKLREFAQTTLELARFTPGAFGDAGFRRSLEFELLEHLAPLVVSKQCTVDIGALSFSSHTQTVRLSEEYLATRLNEPVSVSDLCVVAEVSVRTLRNAFQSVLGVSPNKYLKLRRLQLARMQLEFSAAENTTVTSIALASGFSHLGHFSHDYRRFFGECPSHTLARSR